MPNSNATPWKPSTDSHHPLAGWFHRNKDKLWWLHSAYALILGMGVMWLGKQNFTFLRLAVVHLSFIWLSSLFLPKLLNHPRVPPRWAPRIRLLINFFNKNLYQQMLFFVLPVYYASATLGSRNTVFLLLVILSAILSTLDLIYDRHLSVKQSLTAFFFAFNLFTVINVMLPVLWSVSNTRAMRASAVMALLGFLTLYFSPLQSRFRRIAVGVLMGLLLLGLAEFGRPYIPPAPLRLGAVEIGTGFRKETLQVASPLTELQPTQSVRLHGLTAIRAPLGLKDKVRHRWYMNGKPVCASPSYNMTGGREQGFRLWTACSFNDILPGTVLRLDLETEGGQLIGRATLKTRRSWLSWN